MNKLIKLSIRGISLSQIQSGVYVLLLEEKQTGKMKLPIVIESLQAQSIAFSLGRSKIKEKDILFTHDLFFIFSKTFRINLTEVVIYRLSNGIFCSYILFEKYENSKNEKHKIDSKTSDAIALAVRFQSPIYTTKEIINKAGIYFDDGFPIGKKIYINPSYKLNVKKRPLSSTDKIIRDLEQMTEKDLHNLLDKAILDEYYELAAQIKKELDKRLMNKK